MTDYRRYRQIYATPARPDQPGRIVMDVYEDAFTPLDVMAAMVMWLMEDNVSMEAFRAYLNSEPEEERDYSPEESVSMVAMVHRLIVTIWQFPHHIVWIQGSDGWVN